MTERSEDEELHLLWKRWWRGQSRADRDALVCHYLPLVRFLAHRMGRSVDPANRPDLAGFGVFGLMDAVERFDPSFEVRFETYAARRIRGAIGDGLRTISYFPRGAEKRSGRVIEKVIAVDFQSARTPSGTRLDDTMSDPLAERITDGLELAADHAEVAEALALLSERDRFVIEQHYYRRRPLKSIGIELGVTESRVCQLHRRALRVIEAALVERLSA